MCHMCTHSDSFMMVAEASRPHRAVPGGQEGLVQALRSVLGPRVICYAEDMLKKDLRDNRSIGDLGAHHLLDRAAPQGGKVTVLTHCNTGALATAGYGTALGEPWPLGGMGKDHFELQKEKLPPEKKN